MAPSTPSSRPHRARRLVVAVLPVLLAIVAVVGPVLVIDRVREEASVAGDAAAAAQSASLLSRQLAVTIGFASPLLSRSISLDASQSLGPLAKLMASERDLDRELARVTAGSPEGRAAQRAYARAGLIGARLIVGRRSRAQLAETGAAFTDAADRLSAYATRMRGEQEAAEARASRVTLAVLILAAAGMACSWLWFLRVSSSMQRRHVEALAHLAHHDPLTGLGNRRAFDAAVDELDGQPLDVYVADLDGFKAFNDRFGHPAGDALLVRAAQRLHAVARDAGGSAFRLGGDEFCVLAPAGEGALGLACAQALADHGDGSPVTASVGVARSPQDAPTPRAAFAVADTRLYEVKRGRPDRRRAAATQAA